MMHQRLRFPDRPAVLGSLAVFLATLMLLSGCPDAITLPAFNLNPTANAGSDQITDVGQRVTLIGLSSTDPDDDPLTFAWEQRSGPAVTLQNPSGEQPTFVPTRDGTYEFALTVIDGRGGSDVATVRVFVGIIPPHQCPRADAGIDQTLSEGSAVTLRGGNSADPSGGVLTYEWFQVSGTQVSISDVFVAEPSFAAPPVAAENVELVFELRVTNEQSCTDSDTVVVTVQDRDPIDPCADVNCAADALFCNGIETCKEGVCVSPGDPCSAIETCNEIADSCEAPKCSTSADCNDTDPCTNDDCVDRSCRNTRIAECCRDDADCNDTDPCTNDDCVDRNCRNTRIPECCRDDADCNDGDICVDGKCVPIDLCAGVVCDQSDLCNPEECVEGECIPMPVECLEREVCVVLGSSTVCDGCTYIVDELLHPGPECEVGYEELGRFTDANGSEILHCVKRATFDPALFYVRNSYLTPSHRCPPDTLAGAFEDVDGVTYGLCVQKVLGSSGSGVLLTAVGIVVPPGALGCRDKCRPISPTSYCIELRNGVTMTHCSERSVIGSGTCIECGDGNVIGFASCRPEHVCLNGQCISIDAVVDLLSVDFRVVPDSANAGDSFDPFVEYEIANDRPGAAGMFKVKWYLSRNDQISQLDRLLGEETIAGLAGNSTTGTLERMLTLPPPGDAIWVGDGTYYIGMIVDQDDDVAELEESNNSNQGSGLDLDTVQVNNTGG